jgi:uncharacterized protein with NAD-binding domain and iron-sulfur cluster
LTTAHELADREFEVAVFESNDRFGGKARSMPVDGGPTALHGEHGFRFFPAFYRHVTDTMERIPADDGTVADNLVPTEETLIASVDAPARVATTRQPESIGEWVQAIRPTFAEDLPPGDVGWLIERLLYLLTASDERRDGELDDVSWWDFIDAENRSPAFRNRLGYSVQSLVALRPELGSARTIGTVYLQLLLGQLDPRRPAERILNAPTSVAWIDPWVTHLADLGVTFHPKTPARRLEFDGRRVTGVVVDGPGGNRTIEADQYVLAVPVEVAPRFLTEAMVRRAPELGGIDRLDTAWMNGIQFFLREDVDLSRGHQIYANSPWALTSISQRQFWTGFDLADQGPDAVEGVLSVIASDWDTPGTLHGKPARECTREEIATEIWHQVTTHLDGADGPALTDDLLVDWFLDPAIVETDHGVENRSPLLVNTVGSLRNRPPAATGIENLTLAADYVRTNSDLASMESANEAGRRAANAILDRTGISAPRAQIWPLEEPGIFEPAKRADRLRYRFGLPHPGDVTRSVRSFTRQLRGRTSP